MILPTDNVRVKDRLSYQEIMIKNFDCHVRKLRKNKVVSVKVLWRNQFIKEAIREDEKDMKKRYSYLLEFFENAYQVTKFFS